MTASEWKRITPAKNTLQGIFTLATPSGVIYKEVMLHSHESGKQWICFQGKPWKKPDGSTTYSVLIDFASKEARKKFEDQALRALQLHLAEVEHA